MKRPLLLSLANLILSAGLAQAAFAAPISYPVSFTLSNAAQSTTPGTTLTYSGTLTNTSGNTIYLNGISFLGPFASVDNDPGCVGSSVPCTDETPFLTYVPFSLSASGPDSTYTGALFNLVVPTTSSLGTFTAFVNINGGPGMNDNVPITSSLAFSTTLTPEPSPWLLMATGLAGLAIAHRFRPQTAPATTRL